MLLTDELTLMRRIKSLDVSRKQPKYSGVVILAGQDDDGNAIEYRAGDSSGTILEITNEWGSQSQADAIYNKLAGYQYQGYRAIGSQLDPSAEIGDAVTLGDIYGGVFKKRVSFGRIISTDTEAPYDTEAEHEIQTKSSTDRKYERLNRSLRSSLSINSSKILAEVEDRKSADNALRASIDVNANNIQAKVSSENGSSASDFWWKLLSTGWEVGSSGKTIFSINKSGAYVDGEIRASTGKIGGFDIKSNYLAYNGQTWGGSVESGAYFGQSGIQLGKNFKVDMKGNLTASAGTFGGTLYCDTLYVKNSSGGYDKVSTESMKSNLEGGGAYKSSGWGNYSASTTWSGASYGLDYGNAINSGSGKYPEFFQSSILCCDTLIRDNLKLTAKAATIDGSIVTLAVWT